MLIVIGTNHKYSPIELRERISFSKKGLKDALLFLKEGRALKGGVILSTCNRVEIYASADNRESALSELENFICQYHEIGRERILPFLYIYTGKDAIRHLFEVASGLDSLILGETQILGQARFAFSESQNIDFADFFLKEVFERAFGVAKKIKANTDINKGKVSVGSVAIDFIKEKIGNLEAKNILLIGVGKVTELVLKYLKEEKPNVVFISNRTFEKAKELAGQIGAKAVRFNKLKDYLEEADIVISATASPHYVIKKEVLQHIKNKKLLIIDLAMPRDVEPAAGKIQNVELFCLEDLDEIIRGNRQRKFIEAQKAKKIIDKEIGILWKKLTELEQEPALLQ